MVSFFLPFGGCVCFYSTLRPIFDPKDSRMIALESYLHSFSDLTEQFKTTFGHLDNDQLNWRPDADTWSVAQVMEHLVIINESYYPVFDRVKNGTNRIPLIGKVPFIPRAIGNMIEKSMQPASRARTRTVPVWEPSKSRISNILERFRNHQTTLITHLQGLESFFNKDVVISSPANQYVVYYLDQAVAILLVHEKRHYLQACKILEQQRLPVKPIP